MATISKVAIANMALSHIGSRSSIESFDEQSAEARQVKLWYDYSRRSVLEAFDWNFARKRLTLAEHGDDAPEGVWSYRYQYPSDCVACRYIVNPLGDEADAVPFEVESGEDGTTKSILTDMEDAVLVYTWDLEQTSLFSAQFVMCLSYHLAHLMAMALTGKESIKDKAGQMYLAWLSFAPAYNSYEKVKKPERDAPWIRGRE